MGSERNLSNISDRERAYSNRVGIQTGLYPSPTSAAITLKVIDMPVILDF